MVFHKSIESATKADRHRSKTTLPDKSGILIRDENERTVVSTVAFLSISINHAPMAKTTPFDRHREAYEAWFHRFEPAYRSELAAIAALLPKGRLCEIGIGTGRFALPLEIPMGIDPSKAMLELAARRGLHVVRATAEQLPFPPKSFDGLLMVTTVCFLDDPDLAFRQAFDVLTPGGRLVLGFVDRASPLGEEYERKRASSRFYGPARFWRTDELIETLERVGFRVDDVVQTLTRPLDQISTAEPWSSGHGRGAFVALAAHVPEHHPGLQD